MDAQFQGSVAARLLVSSAFALGSRKQTVYVDSAFCRDVDTAIGYGGNCEPKSVAGAIAFGVLRGVVEFMGDVRGVVGEENRGLVRNIPHFCGENPNDAVFGAIRGDGGGAWIVDTCSALGPGLRG